jgi:hypothetical protein
VLFSEVSSGKCLCGTRLLGRDGREVMMRGELSLPRMTSIRWIVWKKQRVPISVSLRKNIVKLCDECIAIHVGLQYFACTCFPQVPTKTLISNTVCMKLFELEPTNIASALRHKSFRSSAAYFKAGRLQLVSLSSTSSLLKPQAGEQDVESVVNCRSPF